MSQYYVFLTTNEIVRVIVGYEYVFIVNLAGRLRLKLINNWESISPFVRELTDIEKILMNVD